METVITKEAGVMRIAPAGRLDTVNSAELRRQIEAADPTGLDLDLDFAGVEYISSAGLRLLVSLQKNARAGGRVLVLRNTNAVVNEVFRVSGLNKSFTLL